MTHPEMTAENGLTCMIALLKYRNTRPILVLEQFNLVPDSIFLVPRRPILVPVSLFWSLADLSDSQTVQPGPQTAQPGPQPARRCGAVVFAMKDNRVCMHI